jgi:hypothetical protein
MVSVAQTDSIDMFFAEYEAAIQNNNQPKSKKINTETIAQKTLEAVYATKSVERLNDFCITFYREEKYVTEAKRIRDKLAFEQAQNAGTVTAYKDFLEQYPDAMQTTLAQSFINQETLQQYITAKNTDSLLSFANSVSDKTLSQKALQEAEKIIFEQALTANQSVSYANYLAKYPDGTYSTIAKDKYNKALINENLPDYKVSTLINFLKKYPNHPSYQQLLDTLQYIATERTSYKGLQFCNEAKPKQDSVSTSLKAVTKNPNVIPLPRKIIKIYKDEVLTAYIPKLLDSIDFTELQSAFSDADFFVFNDGNAVLFASNREDGYGTDGLKLTKLDTLNSPFDLYVSFKQNGHWKEPLLLPKPVNNEFNQCKPVLSKDKKMLFFSNEYPETYGNSDIYLSYRSDTSDWQNWSVPLHLSYLFNTKGNDFVVEYNDTSIIVKQGFNDEKGQFRQLTTKNGNPMFSFRCGNAKDINGKPASASIIIVDEATNKPFDSVESNSNTGFFAFRKPEKPFAVAGVKKGCIPVLLQSRQTASDSTIIAIQLNEIQMLISKNKIQTLDIPFDDNEMKKLPAITKLYLHFFAQELIEMSQIVSISVFCNSGLKDLSPQELAQSRANLIKSALIDEGMPSERIVAVGFEYKTKSKCRVETGFIENQ